jgi:peptide/nickel transport system substrate-binding protein
MDPAALGRTGLDPASRGNMGSTDALVTPLATPRPANEHQSSEAFRLPGRGATAAPNRCVRMRRAAECVLVRRLATMVLVAALGSACSSQRSRAVASDDPVTLRIGYAAPQDTDEPEGGQDSRAIISFLSEARLVTLTRAGEAEAGLAARWLTSGDGRTWYFWLRPDLQFHGGVAITASTAAKALSQVVAAPRQTLYPGLRDIVSIEAASNTELVIRLRAPSWLLPEALGLENIGDASIRRRAGPFVIGSQQGTEATLLAFDGYYGGRPTIDRITLRAYTRPRATWAALLRGDIDFVYDVAPEALGFLEHARGVQVRSFLRPFVTLLGFNLRHPLLRRPDVRLALNYAIDRKTIVEQVLASRGRSASGHVSPEHWAFDKQVQPFPYRPDRTTTLLAESGANGASFTCLVPAQYPRLERLALLLQRQLIEVGVDMQIEVLPLSRFTARVAKGDFNAYLVEMAGFLNYPYMFWHSGTGDNAPWVASGYTAADVSLDRLRHARTQADAKAAVREFQRALRDDPPAAFLYWEQTSRAMSSRFTLPESTEGDMLSMIAGAKLADTTAGPRAGRLSAAGSP